MSDSSDGYIYTKFITLKNGKRLYAYQVGLKAFRFRAKPRKRQDPQPPLFDD